MRVQRTGNHDDDPRFDRDDEPAWSSIPCHCGARYRVAPWGEPSRWQCEACDAADEDAERTVEAKT